MFARLRENWQYKLLAVAGAVLLHVYVLNQQNPSQARIIPVAVTARNLPVGLLLTSKLVPITVGVTGTAEEINRLTDQNFTATIDLARARPGANAGVPVDVQLVPAGIRSEVTITDKRPGILNVEIAERRRRRLAVAVILSGTAAAGYATAAPSVVPTMATAIGAADAVDSVARLVVRPDVTGAADDVEDDFQIVPVDAQGNDVADVKVKPDFAHVQIRVTRPGLTKDVFVSPSIVGAPRSGYMIGGVTTDPATVPLTGLTSQLSAVGQVTTQPVDVQGADTDVIRPVRCQAPPGGTLASTDTVTVRIRVIPVAGYAPTGKTSTPATTGKPASAVKPSEPGKELAQ